MLTSGHWNGWGNSRQEAGGRGRGRRQGQEAGALISGQWRLNTASAFSSPSPSALLLLLPPASCLLLSGILLARLTQ